jgi:hypothetical protein
MIHIDGLWLFLGQSPIRLSTLITLAFVFALGVWKFRSKGWLFAFYNGIVAAFFMLFLYELIFNNIGRFPPTGPLPPWGVDLMILSLLLGILQADKYFTFNRISIILLSAFVIDWIIWIIFGFQFNFPNTKPLNITAEFFNISTKLFLPFGYLAGLTMQKTKLVILYPKNSPEHITIIKS